MHAAVTASFRTHLGPGHLVAAARRCLPMQVALRCACSLWLAGALGACGRSGLELTSSSGAWVSMSPDAAGDGGSAGGSARTRARSRAAGSGGSGASAGTVAGGSAGAPERVPPPIAMRPPTSTPSTPRGGPTPAGAGPTGRAGAAGEAGGSDQMELCASGAFDGSFTIQTDRDIARLKGCSVVRGDLSIMDGHVSSLHGLEALREVQGRLRIAPISGELVPDPLPREPQLRLESLSGLEGLSSVGALELSELEISDLKPLSGLQQAGDIRVIGLPRLTDLRGLEKASWFALELISSPALRSLEGLTVPPTAMAIAIADDLVLEDLGALRTLTSVATLALMRLPALKTLAGLGSLVEAADVLAVVDCDALTDLTGLAASFRVQSLSIEENDQLRALTGLNLSTAASTARISNNPRLTSLTGLLAPGDNVMNALGLSGLPALTSLAGLEGLRSVNLLGIESCNGLADLTGLSGLQRAEALQVVECAGMRSLNGLSALTEVSDSLGLTATPALTTLQGAPMLARIRLLGLIQTGLPTLDGLTALTQLEALQVVSNAALQNLHGLEAVHGLASLMVSENLALTTLVGLEGITSISVEAAITDNPVLSSLRGLSALTSAPQLAVARNPSLPQCEVDWLYTRVGQPPSTGENGPQGTCAP